MRCLLFEFVEKLEKVLFGVNRDSLVLGIGRVDRRQCVAELAHGVSDDFPFSHAEPLLADTEDSSPVKGLARLAPEPGPFGASSSGSGSAKSANRTRRASLGALRFKAREIATASSRDAVGWWTDSPARIASICPSWQPKRSCNAAPDGSSGG